MKNQSVEIQAPDKNSCSMKVIVITVNLAGRSRVIGVHAFEIHSYTQYLIEEQNEQGTTGKAIYTSYKQRP